MSIYAHINAGVVVELFTPPAGMTIAECFHPALPWVDVTAVSPAPQPGWLATETGPVAPLLTGVWTFAAPPAAAVPVPPVISNFQARAALYQTPNPAVAGETMLDVVNAAVSAAGGLAQLAWTSGAPLYRGGPLVAQIATAMGSTAAAMDAFFIGAAQISA